MSKKDFFEKLYGVKILSDILKVVIMCFYPGTLDTEKIRQDIITEAYQMNRAWSFEILRRINRQISSLDEENLNKLINDLFMFAVSEKARGKIRFKIAQLFSVIAMEKNKLINGIIYSHKQQTIEILENMIDCDFGDQSYSMFVQAFENCI